MNDLLIGHEKDSQDSDTVKGWAPADSNSFNQTKLVLIDTDTECADDDQDGRQTKYRRNSETIRTTLFDQNKLVIKHKAPGT